MQDDEMSDSGRVGETPIDAASRAPEHAPGLATLAIRTGHVRTAEGEHCEPIFATSSFVFASAAEAADRFSGEQPGNIYSRFTNPTVRAFEQRLAAMEGGEACVATASGMAAILATCMGLLQAGDRILAARSLFGSTTMLFDKYLARFGIATDYVPLSDLEAWAAAIRPETKLLFAETPSNPLTEMVAIRPLSEIAHARGCLLAIDNCFCTPALQRPLEHGADLVIHSATKYLDGQGRCVGGAVVGDAKRVGEDVFGVIRTAGPSLSPFNAWLFLKGLETLQLRMQAHAASAAALARWLAEHPAVARVHYPGLPDHPQHHLIAPGPSELAANSPGDAQQQTGGGILAFEVAAPSASRAREAAWSVIDATRMLSITANLGDTKTTITHPATTTHGRLSPEARAAAGISEDLIRVAVGLEDLADIQADLARGLDALIPVRLRSRSVAESR
jgi:O-succinylhomoserine sulfhydrylase